MTATSIERKSLLYRSKVEYGGWTANHVLGCAHGCRYPCYAMTLSKRTGRVSSYEEWLEPRLVSNALTLLDSELRRFAGDIDSVHLCFTTDPFMYDGERQQPIEDIASMSLAMIRRLNDEGIPVTTLTKGVYPSKLADLVAQLHPDNQFGISLVSLNETYRQQWEPGAAVAEQRIASLSRLASRGARTWLSAEPYPTPNIDSTAPQIERLLDAVSFVDKVVFGKWNYNSLATRHDREHAFYAEIAPKVVQWCTLHRRSLHIKTGTPLASCSGDHFLGEGAGSARATRRLSTSDSPS
jgi:DNA repair photolyase